jgi:cyclohexanecarboxyl-CoA dehydrogenase
VTLRDLPVPDDPLWEEIDRLDERLGMARRYRHHDTSGAFPREEFRALGESRLLGLTIPERWGGRGLSLERAARGLFRLAQRGGTLFAKLSLQPEFSSRLAADGSEALVQQYFRPLLEGRRLVGNQITEPGAGSDAAALALRAEPSGDGYRLSGTKSEAAFCEDADAAIVYARTGRAESSQISAFLVPQDLPGVHRELVADSGERWMRRGRIRYEDVAVPTELRLGPEGGAFERLKEELTHERALLGAIYLGVAWDAWTRTVEHVGERRAFGRALARQEAVAFPLVEDRARLEAAWHLVSSAACRLDRGEPAEGAAALAKWYSAESALTAVDHAIQFHGGRGFSEELPFAQQFRDLRSARIAHGTDEIMHVVAAGDLWGRRGADRPSKG